MTVSAFTVRRRRADLRDTLLMIALAGIAIVQLVIVLASKVIA